MLNLQPDGGELGLVGSPAKSIRWRVDSLRGFGDGTADSSAWV
ncbi:hypothetical protein RLEG3_03540 (plasmid) [Rhizobium leguminosarum bv. trifolii WSM1689]|nr:hypothetical protein RLEG3_03540 [Rhizobium leguminosarum bv. trifolii WSM1689]